MVLSYTLSRDAADPLVFHRYLQPILKLRKPLRGPLDVFESLAAQEKETRYLNNLASKG